MPYVAARHQRFNGRDVAPGEPLPECDTWSTGKLKTHLGLRLIEKVEHVPSAPPSEVPASVTIKTEKPVVSKPKKKTKKRRK